MLRREFLSLPALAAIPFGSIGWDKPDMRVHFRFEHPDGSYTTGTVSQKTFVEVAKWHADFDLIFLRPSKW